MEIVKLLAVLCFSLLSGWLYRRGGSDKTWHGKERDWGVSLCTILCIAAYKGWTWWYIPLFLTSWGALSTYWKKSGDCKWYHWFAHGAGIGLAAFPLLWYGVSWQAIVTRTVFCAVAMTAVSEWSDRVEYEEFMRGFIATASVVFL